MAEREGSLRGPFQLKDEQAGTQEKLCRSLLQPVSLCALTTRNLIINYTTSSNVFGRTVVESPDQGCLPNIQRVNYWQSNRRRREEFLWHGIEQKVRQLLLNPRIPSRTEGGESHRLMLELQTIPSDLMEALVSPLCLHLSFNCSAIACWIVPIKMLWWECGLWPIWHLQTVNN